MLLLKLPSRDLSALVIVLLGPRIFIDELDYKDALAKAPFTRLICSRDCILRLNKASGGFVFLNNSCDSKVKIYVYTYKVTNERMITYGFHKHMLECIHIQTFAQFIEWMPIEITPIRNFYNWLSWKILPY